MGALMVLVKGTFNLKSSVVALSGMHFWSLGGRVKSRFMLDGCGACGSTVWGSGFFVV